MKKIELVPSVSMSPFFKLYLVGKDPTTVTVESIREDIISRESLSRAKLIDHLLEDVVVVYKLNRNCADFETALIDRLFGRITSQYNSNSSIGDVLNQYGEDALFDDMLNYKNRNNFMNGFLVNIKQSLLIRLANSGILRKSDTQIHTFKDVGQFLYYPIWEFVRLKMGGVSGGVPLEAIVMMMPDQSIVKLIRNWLMDTHLPTNVFIIFLKFLCQSNGNEIAILAKQINRTEKEILLEEVDLLVNCLNDINYTERNKLRALLSAIDDGVKPIVLKCLLKDAGAFSKFGLNLTNFVDFVKSNNNGKFEREFLQLIPNDKTVSCQEFLIIKDVFGDLAPDAKSEVYKFVATKNLKLQVNISELINSVLCDVPEADLKENDINRTNSKLDFLREHVHPDWQENDFDDDTLTRMIEQIYVFSENDVVKFLNDYPGIIIQPSQYTKLFAALDRMVLAKAYGSKLPTERKYLPTAGFQGFAELPILNKLFNSHNSMGQAQSSEFLCGYLEECSGLLYGKTFIEILVDKCEQDDGFLSSASKCLDSKSFKKLLDILEINHKPNPIKAKLVSRLLQIAKASQYLTCGFVKQCLFKINDFSVSECLKLFPSLPKDFLGNLETFLVSPAEAFKGARDSSQIKPEDNQSIFLLLMYILYRKATVEKINDNNGLGFFIAKAKDLGSDDKISVAIKKLHILQGCQGITYTAAEKAVSAKGSLKEVLDFKPTPASSGDSSSKPTPSVSSSSQSNKR